jgi:hypothetical protein
MSDEFIDPLNDPRFPDRPNSPQFWRLVEIGLRHDGLADELGQAAIETVIEKYIPYQDAVYYAQQRTGQAGGIVGIDPRIGAFVAATWLDAFCKGAEYAVASTYTEVFYAAESSARDLLAAAGVDFSDGDEPSPLTINETLEVVTAALQKGKKHE